MLIFLFLNKSRLVKLPQTAHGSFWFMGNAVI
jgi:hypothetical protein